MPSSRELDAMRRAIVLSAFGLGTTSPNPPAGRRRDRGFDGAASPAPIASFAAVRR